MISGCGEIGRHARFRFWWRNPWGFKSLQPHHLERTILRKKFILFFVFGLISKNISGNEYYDYPLSFIVDACKITDTRTQPEEGMEEEMQVGRTKYRICMNFIMALSTTLNSRCMSKTEKITPEESLTYADLSKVQSTKELINEIIFYYKNNLHFENQIAWVHASKAISQKWPCRK